MANNPTYPVGTIAKLLLISERRVQQLTKEGVIPKSDRGRYELAPSVQGYIRYLQDRSIGQSASGGDSGDYNSEKTRLVKLQADKAELELKELSGELVKTEEVMQEWNEIVSDCKSRLLSLSSKAAPVIAMEINSADCKKVIDDLLHEALNELGNYENSKRKRPDVERNEFVEAAEESNGFTVG